MTLRWPKKPRGTTRKQEKARQAVDDRAARDACVREVFRLYRSRCGRCAKPVKPKTDPSVTEFTIGHTHEKVLRSRGGDPHDPTNCELLCWRCHPVAHGQRVAARA